MKIAGKDIFIRRGTLAEWEKINPVLDKGEPVLVLDGASVWMKIGNGEREWSDLPFATDRDMCDLLLEAR